MSGAHHHSALLVDDVERALAFYVEVFGAEILTRPFSVSSPEVAADMGGPPGMSIEIAMIRIPPAGMTELLHFVGEDLPSWTRHEPGLVPHSCVQVEDVAASLALAEQHGGSRVWPQIATRGSAEMIYIRDPDGNVIELVDVSVEAMVAAVLEHFPEARP